MVNHKSLAPESKALALLSKIVTNLFYHQLILTI